MKRLQNKIAESRMTLSFVSVLGFLICIACGAIGMQLGNTVFSNVAWWEQVLILAVSTMLMVELNNANSLIRIYSRMVSCSFLLLTRKPFSSVTVSYLWAIGLVFPTTM